MKFEFKLKDKVVIKDLEWNGRITAIYICIEGIKYNVRYFYEGSVKEVYFYGDELEKRNES